MIGRLQIRGRHPPAPGLDTRDGDHRRLLRWCQDREVQHAVLLRSHELLSVHQQHREVRVIFKAQLWHRSACVQLRNADFPLRDPILQEEIVHLRDRYAPTHQWKQCETPKLTRSANFNL